MAAELDELEIERLERVSSTDLRLYKFTEIWNKAAFRNEPTIITHYHKDVAAVIPMEMMNRLADNTNEKQQTIGPRGSRMKRGTRGR